MQCNAAGLGNVFTLPAMLAQREFAAENSCVDWCLAAGPHAKERPMDSTRIARHPRQRPRRLAQPQARRPWPAAAARQAGASVAELDLRALGLPVYDGDLEAALGRCPPPPRTMLDAVQACDAMLIVTP